MINSSKFSIINLVHRINVLAQSTFMIFFYTSILSLFFSFPHLYLDIILTFYPFIKYLNVYAVIRCCYTSQFLGYFCYLFILCFSSLFLVTSIVADIFRSFIPFCAILVSGTVFIHCAVLLFKSLSFFVKHICSFFIIITFISPFVIVTTTRSSAYAKAQYFFSLLPRYRFVLFLDKYLHLQCTKRTLYGFVLFPLTCASTIASLYTYCIHFNKHLFIFSFLKVSFRRCCRMPLSICK